MLYCSLDMVHNIFNCYFSFGTIFLPVYPPNSPKNQNLERMKKLQEILSFYDSVPKIMIICHTVPDIWCVTDVIIFHFGSFFPFHPPNSRKNQNWKKKKKWKKRCCQKSDVLEGQISKFRCACTARAWVSWFGWVTLALTMVVRNMWDPWICYSFNLDW